MNPRPPTTQQPALPSAQILLAQIDQRLENLTALLEDMAQRQKDMAKQQEEVQRVDVVDADMTIASMVGFMVKWAIASIPAAIILVILGTIVFGVLRGLVS